MTPTLHPYYETKRTIPNTESDTDVGLVEPPFVTAVMNCIDWATAPIMMFGNCELDVIHDPWPGGYVVVARSHVVWRRRKQWNVPLQRDTRWAVTWQRKLY